MKFTTQHQECHPERSEGSVSVVFCRSFFQKIAQVMREPGEHVIIDDRYAQLVEALHEVESQAGDDSRYQRMIEGARRRLTIVAFGVTALAEQDLLQLM